MTKSTCGFLTVVAAGVVVAIVVLCWPKPVRAIEGCVLMETAVAMVGTDKRALEALADKLGIEKTRERRRDAEACLRKIKWARVSRAGVAPKH